MSKSLIILSLALLVIVAAKILLRGRFLSHTLSRYYKKKRIMNESEHALYINLGKTLSNQFMVLSKVRIEDFVEAGRGDGRYGARGRIKSRHVDFLICDRTTTEPLLAIELDGKSHLDTRRQARDRFVDDLYNAIGLPAEHLPVGCDFATEATRIRTILDGKLDQEMQKLPKS